MRSKTGRHILDKLGIGYHNQQGEKTTLTEDVRRALRVDPIPRNVHPEYNKGRRRARAKALTDKFGEGPGARFVDAAEGKNGTSYTAAVVDADGATRTAASIKCERTEEAEEVAIALALADGDCVTVLSDSRQAIRNYAKGEVSATAALILERADLRIKRRLVWFQ